MIREAIANALAHRSYELNRTPVRIEIRPSSVLIRSPGGLPEPVTVENIRETSAPRNMSVIAEHCERFGLAEDAGRGINVMEDTMLEEMLDPPGFEDHGHEVVVTLPVRSAVAPVGAGLGSRAGENAEPWRVRTGLCWCMRPAARP